MARQPEDHKTPDMFVPGPKDRTTGHTMTIGKTGSGKTTLQALHNARVSRFRASRKLFPAVVDAACEVCGRRHDGDCNAKGEVKA